MYSPQSLEVPRYGYSDFESVAMYEVAYGLSRDPTLFGEPQTGDYMLRLAGVARDAFWIINLTDPPHDVEGIAIDFAVGTALENCAGKRLPDEPEYYRTYVTTAALRHGIGIIRKKTREFPLAVGEDKAAAWSSGVSTSDPEIDNVELSIDLEKALAAIHPDRAATLRSLYIDRNDFRTTAEATHTNEGTARSRRQRAVVEMRALLTGEGYRA